MRSCTQLWVRMSCRGGFAPRRYPASGKRCNPLGASPIWEVEAVPQGTGLFWTLGRWITMELEVGISVWEGVECRREKLKKRNSVSIFLSMQPLHQVSTIDKVYPIFIKSSLKEFSCAKYGCPIATTVGIGRRPAHESGTSCRRTDYGWTHCYPSKKWG